MGDTTEASLPQTRRRAQDFVRWEYKKEPIPWRPTTAMNVRDLSNDDDFLSHILVEKLGANIVPLLVHRMDSTRQLPKASADELLAIVRKLVSAKSHREVAIKQAVDDLLSLVPVQYYMRNYTQKQINALATHASRYFEIYMPSGSIEIAHTSRYTHKTGKSELCMLAARPLAVGTIITDLKGSMADLSKEEEHKLKHADPRTGLGIRRDFSVIHSRQKKMNHLFLGPARFVNHDCKNNVELFRDGRCITFRVLRPIAMGEEITTHYGSSYFGYKNKDCLCATCERRGKGGYAPRTGEEEGETLFTAVLRDYESDSSIGAGSDDEPEAPVNVNERRTRRGVYHVNKDKGKQKQSDCDTDDSGSEDDVSSRPTPQTDTNGQLASLPVTSVSPPTPSIVTTLHSASTESRSSQISAASGSSLTSVSSGSSPLSSVKSGHAVPSTTGEPMSVATKTAPIHESLTVNSFVGASSPSSDLRSPTSTYVAIVDTSERAVSPMDLKGKGRANDENDDDDEDEGDESEGISSRSLRPRRPKPSHFYDDTRRRAPRKSHGTERSQSAMSAPPSGSAVALKPHVASVKPLINTLAHTLKGLPGNTGLVSALLQIQGGVIQDEDDRFPKCKTCSTVIPVIYDNAEKVEWGPGDDDQSGEHECPRCLRHFNIYQVCWPLRVRPRTKNGVSLTATPAGQITPLDPKVGAKAGNKVTQPLLPVIDRKLAAVGAPTIKADPAKAPKPGGRTAPVSESAPPRKRRKLEHTPDADPATQRSSARPRVPSAKVLAAEGATKRKPGRPRKRPLLDEDMSPLPRGRPRKRALTPVPAGMSNKARIAIAVVAKAMKAKKEQAKAVAGKEVARMKTDSSTKRGRAERASAERKVRLARKKPAKQDTPVSDKVIQLDATIVSDNASLSECDEEEGEANGEPNNTFAWLTEAEDDGLPDRQADGDADSDPGMPELYASPEPPGVAQRDPTPVPPPPAPRVLDPPPLPISTPASPRVTTPHSPHLLAPSPPRATTPPPSRVATPPPPRLTTPLSPPRVATPPPPNCIATLSPPNRVAATITTPPRITTRSPPRMMNPSIGGQVSPLSSPASSSTAVPEHGLPLTRKLSPVEFVPTPPRPAPRRTSPLSRALDTAGASRSIAPPRKKRSARERSPSVVLVPSPPRPSSSRDSRLSSLSDDEVEIMAGPIRRRQEVIYLDDSDDSSEAVPRKRPRPSATPALSAIVSRRLVLSGPKHG